MTTIIIERDGIEIEVECDGHFYPGRYSGPPEDCEPDDYDFEILGVTPKDVVLTRAEERRVEEMFFDHMRDEASDWEPGYPDDDYPDDDAAVFNVA